MQRSKILVVTYLLLFTTLSTFAQSYSIQPFSRDDSAALKNYQTKAEEQFAQQDKKTASDWLNRIGLIYWEHNDFREACKYYEQSLKINQELGNENGVTMINSNLGLMYADLGEYEKSITFFKLTLAARRAKKEKVGIISALINLSVVLNNQKRFKESIVYLDEALELARQMNDEVQMRNCYGYLSETHEKAGNTEEAIKYFNLYSVFFNLVQKREIGIVQEELVSERLKVENSELVKRNQELEIFAKQRELSEKETLIVRADSTNKRLTKSLTKSEMEIRMMNQETKILALESDRKLQYEKAKQRYMMIAGGFLVLILFGMFYAYGHIQRANKKLAEQNQTILVQKHEITEQNQELERINDEVELKNKEITASINYASLIQSASLSKSLRLSTVFPESFIFFKPKDIVSGDFYWYETVGDVCLIAAVDCTGHGVPGGFMSMIANNLLRDIVIRRGVVSPREILIQLDEGVKLALNQSDNGNKDGMDIALCSINKKDRRVKFSGAKNPMLLIQNGELHVVKGTKRPIGGTYRRSLPDFEEIEFKLENEALVYLYSDGFQDQFGGVFNKKYSNQRFRDLLFSVQNESLQKQYDILNDELLDWKRKQKQVDDILVMGVKIVCS